MTDSGCSCGCAAVAAKAEAKTLRWLLAINAAMFVVEIVAGWIAQSTGLIADSLDMFADAAVYGLALYAVGHAGRQLRVARLAGWVELLLALGALSEVLRRWIFSTNDVLANLGVILAGALVAWSGSNVPDLVIGTLIGLLVLNGARPILALKT